MSTIGKTIGPVVAELWKAISADQANILAALQAANTSASTLLVGLIQSALPNDALGNFLKPIVGAVEGTILPILVTQFGSEEAAVFAIIDAWVTAEVAKLEA